MAKESEKYPSFITEAVVNFANKTRFNDLPPEVVHEQKRQLLDIIGVALAGSLVDKGRLGIKLAQRLGGYKESTIIGTGDKVSSANAAFANGELMNALDFDSMNSGGHWGPFVVPAVLALAEQIEASGEELILAIAVGREIGYRIARSLSGTREFTNGEYVWSPVHGYSHYALAAALGAGKVFGLDKDKLRHAVGIAGHLTAVPTFTKFQRSVPVAMTKYGSAGWAAHVGVVSVLLADIGYFGDTTVLDGEWGFWRFYASQKWKYEEILEGLGDVWPSIEETYKPLLCSL